MAPFDRPCTTVYWSASAIVNIALCCTVFELLDVEYYRDLEIWVRGTESGRLGFADDLDLDYLFFLSLICDIVLLLTSCWMHFN